MFPWLSDMNVRSYANAASRYYEILRERESRDMTNKDHIERTKRMIDWQVLGLIAINRFPKTLCELGRPERNPRNQAGC